VDGTLGAGAEGAPGTSEETGVREASKVAAFGAGELADAAEDTMAAAREASAAGALAASTGSGALASGTGERGGGAAQPVSPGDAGGAPPTIKTVATIAHG